MLLPDERIARDSVQGIMIIGAEGPERDKLPRERRLEVKRHGVPVAE
jgi:hypothetical protein